MGIIFDIKRFAVHDGPGIRTTVFFKGCPLRCSWCHNPESYCLKPEQKTSTRQLGNKTFAHTETIGREYTTPQLVNEIIKDKAYWNNSGGGVTLSGGEPLFQPRFCIALLQALQLQNIHTTLDTCGETDTDIFNEVLQHTNLVLFDLKLTDANEHAKHTGIHNQRILHNFKLLMQSGVQTRVRIPVIPQVNFGETHFRQFAGFLQPFKNRITQIDLLPFHNTAKHKFKNITPPVYQHKSLNKNNLLPFKTMLEATGLKVTIGG